MKLNKNDLRKLLYDFNSISNRLMQADFNDYLDVLSKFINYIQATPLINDYIIDCGSCDQNLDDEFQEVRASYGQCIFTLGATDEEEVRNVFAILKYIVDNKILIHRGVALGYSNSREPQDKVRGFNDRVAMVLIRHIERYLTKIGIDMGIDEKTTYSITVRNGQVIIANDDSTVYAPNTVGIDTEQLSTLIDTIKNTSSTLSPAEIELLNEHLEVIEEEAKRTKPRKSFLRTALSGISAIKGTAEFSAAIADLIQFIQPFLG